MQTEELITVTEYCLRHHAEPAFITALEETGLIRVTLVAAERYIHYSELPNLEHYTRWYYEMDINIGGIDAMQHMLEKLAAARAEINNLKQQLNIYRR